MNDNSSANGSRSRDPYARFRLIALIAAVVGVILLAAAAFVLSYGGIHQIALTAGVSPRLARVFPLILDAMLVVACAAVLSLRGSGWWRRGYSWLITLVLLIAMAVADAVHATGTHLPRRPVAAAVAVVPWVLLLLAFSLLLSMLRQFRHSRAALASQDAGRPAATRAATPAEARAHAAPAPGVTVTRPRAAEPVRPGLDAILAAGSAPPLTVRGETGPADRSTPAAAGETAPSPAATNGAAAPAAAPGDAAAQEKPPEEKRTSNGVSSAGPPSDDEPTAPARKPPATPQPASQPPAEQATDAAPTADHEATDQPTSGQVSDSEPPGREQPTEEHSAATEQPAGEQSAAADELPGEHPADAESPAQPGTAEPPTGEQPSAEQPSEEQPAGEQPAGEQRSAEQPAGEQPSEEQPEGAEEPPASSGSGGIHVPHQPRRAPVPAPSPHFDRLRSTPTPPEEEPESDS